MVIFEEFKLYVFEMNEEFAWAFQYGDLSGIQTFRPHCI